ncbi:hypothetical protein ACFFGH_16620 [Lysobacter korlensis]|uniref:Uncharacterized protein n=1 Tax=Lysobacter korlensis TaxID=553636 RepID=A0ABV6RR59_9GAMM
MNRAPQTEEQVRVRRQRARRTAIWIAVAAVAVYLGFILINLPSQ